MTNVQLSAVREMEASMAKRQADRLAVVLQKLNQIAEMTGNADARITAVGARAEMERFNECFTSGRVLGEHEQELQVDRLLNAYGKLCKLVSITTGEANAIAKGAVAELELFGQLSNRDQRGNEKKAVAKRG